MQSIRDFLKGIDDEEGTVLKAWEKHRTKKPKKSSYMIYVDNVTDAVAEAHPDKTSREVREQCRLDWKQIKEEDGKVYMKYEHLSSFYTEYGYEPEVSCPFHLFSLFKRAEVKEANPALGSDEITQILKTMWSDTEDKDEWDF